jgi:RNA polymerase-binding transcription factor DksA
MSKRDVIARSGRKSDGSAAAFRAMLLSRRQHLLESIRRDRRDLHLDGVDLSTEPLGEVGDRPSLTPEAETAYEIIGSRTRVLKEIDRALERLNQGAYGVCEDCGGSIAPRRLQVLPFAVRCTPCQESRERKPATTAGARGRWR